MDSKLTHQVSNSFNTRTIDRLLPIEVLHLICEHLPNSDIKNLRLTSSFFATAARLGFRRVFLSANPRNIEVFIAIASHSVFCTQVVEIIYDDALLPATGSPLSRSMWAAPSQTLEEKCRKDFPPAWIRQACTQDLDALVEVSEDDRRHFLKDYLSRNSAWQNSRIFHWERSLPYYFQLLQEQSKVLHDKSYKKALNFGLARFCSLRKITITAATHGRLFNPLYHTPMIRQFPPLFQYPIPHGWFKQLGGYEDHHNWDTASEDWLGVRAVIEALSENVDDGRVTELAIDAHSEDTGLDVGLFKTETKFFRKFAALVARENFTKLKLDLSGVGEVSDEVGEEDKWHYLSNGLLLQALSGAKNLTHLSVSTNEGWRPNYGTHEPKNPIPLRSMIPRNCSARLKHFSLACFWVQQSDLVAFLRELPETLETIELSYLNFSQGGYRGTLEQMRHEMSWQHREKQARLMISIHGVETSDARVYGKGICLDKEVQAFFYEGGINPFSGKEPMPNAIFRNLLEDGVGTITDAFNSQIPPFI